MKKTIIESLRLIVIAVFLSVGLSIASAASTWTGPAAGVTPPNSNVDAPINVGSSGQSKDGNLLIINSQGLINGLIVANGNVGIGATTTTAKLTIGGIAGIDGIRFPDGTLQTSAAGASTAKTLHSQEFTSGSGTWTVPANVTNISISGTGGGAGGNGGKSPHGAGGGGSGSFAVNVALNVVPGQIFNYTIAAGGAGGAIGAKAGEGGTTIFGSLVLPGGHSSSTLSAGGNGGAYSYGYAGAGSYGQVCISPSGGDGGIFNTVASSPFGTRLAGAYGGAGGGGGTSGGQTCRGGAGGRVNSTPGVVSDFDYSGGSGANSVYGLGGKGRNYTFVGQAAQGYGAGGAGGGGYSAPKPGGAGGGGYIKVEWFI